MQVEVPRIPNDEMEPRDQLDERPCRLRKAAPVDRQLYSRFRSSSFPHLDEMLAQNAWTSMRLLQTVEG